MEVKTPTGISAPFITVLERLSHKRSIMAPINMR